ncbi:MAG: 1-acyl-sn-glycerol-3-phosphate acyltransferase [Acidobacteriota bacterium]|nr:1-acyl-sn-glycerol-3-phosphate acyltransferase [Acidobacteriota bacterium]
MPTVNGFPGRRRPSVWLATLTGNVFLVLGTLVMATLALLVGWLPPRGDWVYRVARLWSRGVLLSSGVRVVSAVETALEPSGQHVFMANHRSLFDIPVLIATLPGQTRFLAKRSLFQIPVFGWALRLGGFITIDRKNLSSARDSFSQAVARLRTGTSILVFPEGTRSTTGDFLPFRRGGFLLALKSGLPIVPVGIRGSRDVQAKTSFWIRPGTVSVHYGSPIDTATYSVSTKDELMGTVRERILALVADDSVGSDAEV